MTVIRNALMLAAAAFAASASAVRAEGLSINDVASRLEAAGATAEVDTASADPVIFAESDGFNFALLAYSCEGAEPSCRDFMFSAYFEAGPGFTTEDVNEYNEGAIAGRAYIDGEGDANLEHFFSVSEGEDDLIERNLDIWRMILPDFAAFVGQRSQDAGS